MNILVTGATGFTGFHLVRNLKEYNNVVSLVHNVRSGTWLKESLGGSILVQGDLRDPRLMNEIISRYEIQQVYHTAALAKVKTAFKDPYGTYDTNVMGTVSLLEACRRQNVEKALIMVTDKVYGEGIELDEFSPLEPSEPYASSKIAQAIVAQSYIKTYGMDIRMPVCCNIFGFDPYSNRIVPNVVKACLRGESPVVFENDDSIREYVYINDVLLAFEEIMKEPKTKVYGGFYNLATGNVYNQQGLIFEILKFFPDLKATKRTVDLPPQIKAETMATVAWDWKPTWGMNEALRDTIRLFELYKEDWIR